MNIPQVAGTNPAPDNTQAPDNTGVTLPTETENFPKSDNAGQPVVPETFWGQAETDPSQALTAQKEMAQQLGQQIQQRIQKIGSPLMTAEAVNAMQEGDFDPINRQFQEQLQTVARDVIGMSLQIMQNFRENLLHDVEARLQDRLTERDVDSELAERFEFARDPRTRPIVQKIFQQALVHEKGNRSRAMEMTQIMLQTMAQVGRKDMGIESAPRNPNGTASEVNWLETLMSPI